MPAYDPYADYYLQDPSYVPPPPVEDYSSPDAAAAMGYYASADPSTQQTVYPPDPTTSPAPPPASSYPVTDSQSYAPTEAYAPVSGGVDYNAQAAPPPPAEAAPATYTTDAAQGYGPPAPAPAGQPYDAQAAMGYYASGDPSTQQTAYPPDPTTSPAPDYIPAGGANYAAEAPPEPKPGETYLGGINPVIPRADAWTGISPTSRNHAGLDGIQQSPDLLERHETRGVATPSILNPVPYEAGQSRDFTAPTQSSYSPIAGYSGIPSGPPETPMTDLFRPLMKEAAMGAMGDGRALGGNQTALRDADLPSDIGDALHRSVGNPADTVILPSLQASARAIMGDANRKEIVFDPMQGRMVEQKVDRRTNPPLFRDDPNIPGSPTDVGSIWLSQGNSGERPNGPADAAAVVLGSTLNLNASPTGGLHFDPDAKSGEKVQEWKNIINSFGALGKEDYGANETFDKNAVPLLDTIQDAVAKTENNPGYDLTDPGTAQLAGEAVAPTVQEKGTDANRNLHASLDQILGNARQQPLVQQAVQQGRKTKTDLEQATQGAQGTLSHLGDQAQSAVQSARDSELAQNVEGGVTKAKQLLRGQALKLAIEDPELVQQLQGAVKSVAPIMNTPLPTFGQDAPGIQGLLANALQTGSTVGQELGEGLSPAASVDKPVGTAGNPRHTGGVAAQERAPGSTWPDPPPNQGMPQEIASGIPAQLQGALDKTGIDEQALATGKDLLQRAEKGLTDRGFAAPSIPHNPLQAAQSTGSSLMQRIQAAKSGGSEPTAPVKTAPAAPNVAAPPLTVGAGLDYPGQYGHHLITMQQNGDADSGGNLSGNFLAKLKGFGTDKDGNALPAMVDAQGNWTADAVGRYIDETAVGSRAKVADLLAIKGAPTSASPAGAREATDADVLGGGPAAGTVSNQGAASSNGSGTGSSTKKPWVNYGSGGGGGGGNYSYGGRSSGGGGGYSSGGGRGSTLSPIGPGSGSIDDARSVLGPDFMSGFMDNFAFKDMFGADFPFGPGGFSGSTGVGSRKASRTSKRKRTKGKVGTTPSRSSAKKPTPTKKLGKKTSGD